MATGTGDRFDCPERWHVIADHASLVRDVSQRIYCAARYAIALRDAFHLVLAGGSTPQAVYRELAGSDADWARWHIYYGDERCLPADHPDRNSVMASRNWLDQVAIPVHNVHPIPAELGARAAAHEYARLLAGVRPFDLVLLGMGEDGHTASLFPGLACEAGEAVHAVFGAPKPPPERVSLSANTLSDCCAVMIMVAGAGKRAAVRRWRDGENLPVACIHGHCSTDVFLDPSASGEPAED